MQGGYNIPAAAAASTGDPFASDELSWPRGLRSLPSGRRVGGERERRSNLEALFGSGSVWSNRDLLAVRRSESSMVEITREAKDGRRRTRRSKLIGKWAVFSQTECGRMYANQDNASEGVD